MNRDTLNIAQAADYAGVSRRTIYNWLHAGKLDYIRTAGGSVRIFPESLYRQPNGQALPASASIEG
jgi:excisionase family DNA binding protein